MSDSYEKICIYSEFLIETLIENQYPKVFNSSDKCRLFLNTLESFEVKEQLAKSIERIISIELGQLLQ